MVISNLPVHEWPEFRGSERRSGFSDLGGEMLGAENLDHWTGTRISFMGFAYNYPPQAHN
jgi:hypothetical protein